MTDSMCVCTIVNIRFPHAQLRRSRRQNRTWKVFGAFRSMRCRRVLLPSRTALKSRLVPFVPPNELRTCFERISHRLQRYAPLALKVIVAQAVESQFVLVVPVSAPTGSEHVRPSFDHFGILLSGRLGNASPPPVVRPLPVAHRHVECHADLGG